MRKMIEKNVAEIIVIVILLLLMSSCCTRKRTWKDIMFLPIAVVSTLLGFGLLLTIEMSIAYALGFI